jgi:hypothetical protein
MSTVTTYLNLVKPANTENFSRATYNTNLDLIDAYAVANKKARNACYNMKLPRTSTAGLGVNWGHLQLDTGRDGSGKQNINNDFSVVDNTGTAGQSSEKGRVRITKEGIYALSGYYSSTSNPGSLNFAVAIEKVEGGSDKITMNRPGTYGDWEAVVGRTGVYLKVGDYITGYQANSNASTWAIGLNITYLGEV